MERCGYQLQLHVKSNNVVQAWCNLPAGTRTPGRAMKIDRESFGKFFNGTPGKEWDDYAARLRNAAAGEDTI